jgi:hypothetical protein
LRGLRPFGHLLKILFTDRRHVQCQQMT